jgi:KUP system potassium uptake protein
MSQVIADVVPVTPTRNGTAFRRLMLGALGVVYGDIGTSPLYTIKQCFNALGGATPTAIYGVLSLITWALMVVVTLKYVCVIMRADNRGEGGILALTALALRVVQERPRAYRWVLAAGFIGAALFYGDGVITPAISVLSAVEGLNVATPLFEPYVIPATIVLLIALFLVQRHGTAGVGAFFGPVMIVWFVAIALFGIAQIVREPKILMALNPLYGIDLLVTAPWAGFVLLGAVVLAVTGAEALYADMGHFGDRPIWRAWLFFVFPCLLLNYFGQGGLLLDAPDAVENPFYRLVPSWGLLPMVVLASAATVIASQAVISGAFSLTRQAVQLGYLPRLEVRHTSEEEIGQVYVPRINYTLLVAVLALVIGFKSSDNLGAAYGIAVTGTMLITTALAFIYMRSVGWPLYKAVPLFALFLAVDAGFFGANLLKIEEGGWFPLVVAACVYMVMSSWIFGRQRLYAQRFKDAMPMSLFIRNLKPDRPARVPGTAVYMTGSIDNVPSALLHNIKHNKVLHERNVLMTVRTEDIPRVADEQRIEIHDLGGSFYTIVVRYGFMEEPNIPRALAQCRAMQMRFSLMETSFFVGREKLVARKGSSLLRRWGKQLFILMSNTMLDATEFFRIPANRAVELGGQIEI